MSSSSVELWQSLVDAFASLHDGVHHHWVVERGKYPDFPENDEANALLSDLWSLQRMAGTTALGAGVAAVLIGAFSALHIGRRARRKAPVAIREETASWL